MIDFPHVFGCVPTRIHPPRGGPVGSGTQNGRLAGAYAICKGVSESFEVFFESFNGEKRRSGLLCFASRWLTNGSLHFRSGGLTHLIGPLYGQLTAQVAYHTGKDANCPTCRRAGRTHMPYGGPAARGPWPCLHLMQHYSWRSVHTGHANVRVIPSQHTRARARTRIAHAHRAP